MYNSSYRFVCEISVYNIINIITIEQQDIPNMKYL